MNQPTTDTFRVSADAAEETVDHSLTGYVLPARCGSWGYGGAVVVAALALLGGAQGGNPRASRASQS